MKPSRPIQRLNSVIIACALPPLTAGAANLYWAAPVGGGGTRDGTWSTGAVNWNPVAGNPAAVAWPVAGTDLANFTAAEGGVVTASGAVQTRGIVVNSAGTYVINGGTLIWVDPAAAITVASGILGIGANLSASGLTLTKTGAGSVIFNGTVDVGALNIQVGGVSLSGNNLIDTAAVTTAGTLMLSAADTIGQFTSNGGTVGGTAALTVTGAAVFNGGVLNNTLIANGGATLHNGTTVAATATLKGNTATDGNVLASGTLGNGALRVTGGTLTLNGSSTNTPVGIASGATLIDAGNLANTGIVINSGTLSVDSNDVISIYLQNAGTLNGSGILTASNGATLAGGSVAASLLGNTTSHGIVSVSGSLGGGALTIADGTLTLTGTTDSTTMIAGGATLNGTGTLNGNLTNHGILAVGSMGNAIILNGNLVSDGTIELSLNNQASFEHLHVSGNAGLGGGLAVTNTGAGLAAGQQALIINAGAYGGSFASFVQSGFANGVLFDNASGRLIGLDGGTAKTSQTYLNLNGSQTHIYLSLYDDAVQPGVRNVTTVFNPLGPNYTINFTSGIANGDAQLIDALNLTTFTVPGTVFAPTINQLSPEVHRGMADHSKQTLRSHVREGVEAAAVSRTGKTQVFASVHSTTAGAEHAITDASYDTDMVGVTAGVRHDINPRLQIGGLLGCDDGCIKGALIDTDAQGLAIGAFGRYLLDEPSETKLAASLSYGMFDYAAERRSYGGMASANGLGSDAWELALGVSTVAFEKNGLRIIPNATFRYMSGAVDGFVEKGPGVGLAVDKQDIDSVLLDLGVDIEYAFQKQFTLYGHIGYVTDFSDSDNPVSARFTAAGVNAVPFSVSAPGIDDEALVVGCGVFHDISDSVRVGMTYLGEFRKNSHSAQTIGVSASCGF